MIIKIKAFIYRFSNIFGLHIYLAKKEETEYLNTVILKSPEEKGIYSGLWQGMNGFTTVLTMRRPFYKVLVVKIKHAFDFRSWND